MSAPTLIHNYPSDTDTGIPVGETILLYFDVGVDSETIKSSIVLYGRDFDMTSGPEEATWIDDDTGDNKFWLKSPGFKGTVPLDFQIVYFDTSDSDYPEVDAGTITSQTDETEGEFGHLVKITPKTGALAPDTTYTLYVNGDNESNNMVGVSCRTVFDVVPDPGNVGVDGSLKILGTWDGATEDTVNVKVTTAGDIGTAKYKWWYTSLGESSAVTGRVTSRRYRKLADGIQIRFTGSGFEANDIYTVNVTDIERMATSYSISFTTNDGSWTAAPADPSTPATSSPPDTVLPSIASSTEYLSVIEMIPTNGSYNNRNSNREITIVFSDDLDEDTITDTSVRLYSYPVSGFYSGTSRPKELEKELSVDGDTLTIRF